MIGTRLREARLARQLSLNAVAQKADISVATLSRIERDQQRIDVELLLSLMRILKINAQDVLDEEPSENGIDPMVSKISALPSAERTKLWRGLATSRKSSGDRHGAPTRALALQVEEFLAQIDFLRGEIEAVRKKLR
jgi:transcriptional regulator with XRE-family HTH domain